MQYLKLSYIATNNNLIVVISYCMHGLWLIFLFIVFNTGFIQPAFVEKMLLADDPAGFVDRQLFDFPPERDMYLDDLKVPVPDDVPDIESVLKVN